MAKCVLCRWIKDFLDDRTQKVCIDGHLSSSSTVQSGVPQGTVIGPLLFFCFINDLPSVVDPNTHYSGPTIYKFQKDLTGLAMWGQQWGMHFNTGKCNILTTPNSGKHHPIFYNINDLILQQVSTAKYLGITVHKYRQ